MVFASFGARIVLGSLPTGAIDPGWASIVRVLAAGAVFFLIESFLVGVLVNLAKQQQSLRDLAGEWNDNVLEIATICLGMMTAFVIADHPALVVLVFLPLVILHRVGLVKPLETLAATDQKTGLLTAGAWQHTAVRELSRARGMDTVGVLMIDLDHFKRVNDKHGHIAGDAVLQAVAAVVKAATRDYDAVGRFGGEEFVVLLPGTSPSDVVAVAERIRRAIEVMSVESPGQPGAGVMIEGLSASIGVAVYPLAGLTVDEILLAADNAAYEAKDNGRNLVVTWDSLAAAG
ncbi:MAG TPA: GGDEF domain-containing protein [Pseudonocardiaceae bacterium]|nr:GGDEF domain-containing protein [Pseudonocardiaceae bacterium]